MTYQIFPTRRFEKSLRLLRKRGKHRHNDALEEVLDLLATHDDRSLFVLAQRWKDHELKGNMRGVRELHLRFDCLLLYRVKDNEHVIDLLNIVTHDELEKM